MSEVLPFQTSIDVTTNKTLALVDCGVVQNVVADAITVSLPSTATGMVFTIRNGGDNGANTPSGAVTDGSCAVTISPAAADKISGLLATPVDNKDLINTKATAKIGDFVTLAAETDGWVVIAAKGTWVRE